MQVIFEVPVWIYQYPDCRPITQVNRKVNRHPRPDPSLKYPQESVLLVLHEEPLLAFWIHGQDRWRPSYDFWKLYIR